MLRVHYNQYIIYSAKYAAQYMQQTIRLQRQDWGPGQDDIQGAVPHNFEVHAVLDIANTRCCPILQKLTTSNRVEKDYTS